MKPLRPSTTLARIVDALRQGPRDTRTLQAQLGIPRQNMAAMLRHLRIRGDIIQATPGTIGRYGKPSTWSLPTAI